MKVLYTYSLGALLLLCAALFGCSVALFDNEIVDFDVLEHYDPGKPSIILDDEGVEWARFARDKREPIDIELLPQHLIDAFIAAEDRAFFSHCGISFKGIIRSLLINLYNGRTVQGASTITQQLVKLLYFTSSKTVWRKIKEQIVAVVVEQQYSKHQILQTYLNHVYFGCGIYGVEAASQRFWSKSASELTIDEAALLAGIVKNPGNYCPLVFPRSGQQRRNVVIRSMYHCGFITESEYRDALVCDVAIASLQEQECGFHLKEMIRMFVESLFGREVVYSGGLIIQTTINTDMQLSAERHFKEHVGTLRDKFSVPVDGALLTIEGQTGAIKALIGGYDFVTSKFNRALQAKRQIGSMLKLLVYATAIERGLSFADMLVDEPLAIEFDKQVWKPRNDNRMFLGNMTRALALSRSNNIVTIKTLLEVGCQPVVDMVKRFKFTQEPPPYPSLSLGCIDCSLQEACSMFNVFAQHGMYTEPFVISWIKDQMGTKVYKNTPNTERVIASDVADQVSKVLGISIQRARSRFPESWIESEAIGKTGTTNRSRTCWFIGATPEYTTGVYIGCDDNRPLGNNVYGVQTAFPIWLRMYKDIPLKIKQFVYDQSLSAVTINGRTGEPVSEGDQDSLTILVPQKNNKQIAS